MTLWFDVERGCNTTKMRMGGAGASLWFDVERGCNTTISMIASAWGRLWFDVGKSQSKIKIWSLLERETDSSVTGI